MRFAWLLLGFIILGLVAPSATVRSQPANTHYVVLYAHASAESLFLNALPEWGGQKPVEVSDVTIFSLTPILGQSLRIYGGISATVYLRASTEMFGDLVVDVAERKSTGEVVLVPGARIESPVSLDDEKALPFTLGVGIIEYEFSKGSSILLRVHVESENASGTPYLVYDGAATPTSLRLPVAMPLTATWMVSSEELQFDEVLRLDTAKGHVDVSYSANVTDALGVYRFEACSATLTSTNGSQLILVPSFNVSSVYDAIYIFNASLGMGEWDVSLQLSDISGENYLLSDSLWVTPFHKVMFRVTDYSAAPLEDAVLNVTSAHGGSWSTLTDATGWATLTLPSSDVLGPLNATVNWRGTRTVNSINVVGDSTILFKLSIYDVGLRIRMNGIPLVGVNVSLTQEDRLVAQGRTGFDGALTLKRIPAGNYTLHVQYLSREFETAFTANSTTACANCVATIDVPAPQPEQWIAVILVVAATSSSIVLVERKRARRYPQSFGYLNTLVSGGLPEACFMLILGNSGSGKSVLLQSLAAEHALRGFSAYVTNTEYPDNILRDMVSLGILPEENRQKLLFVDAYSALGGTPSEHEFQVSSHTDLTSLGLNISKCLERAGPNADVYLDSLNPMLGALRIDYVINFLQSIAAKIKANEGKLCITVGTGIEKSEITKLEEAADCVVETQLQDLKKGQRRRLRVKKLRGKPYVDKWVDFQIESGKGIVFLSKTKL